MNDSATPVSPVRPRWMIAAAAVVMQMCLGVLYAWSVFRPALKEQYGWTPDQTIAPYRYSLLFFTIAMIIAGFWQDKKGPRLVGSVGGALLGLGCLLSAYIGNTVNGLILAYGVIGGLGIGLAYVTPVATCVKWFPDKRGTMVGLAVMGFGAGTVVFAPILARLIGTDATQYARTLPLTFQVMAVIMFVFVIGAAQFFTVPPAGWKPEGWSPPVKAGGAGANDFTAPQMLRTWQFWALWVCYFLGSSVGLTTIGEAKVFAERLSDSTTAAAAVSILAVFNGLGRVAWGAISDRIGRVTAVALMGGVYALACALLLRTADTYTVALIGLCLVGFAFGGFLGVMPAFNAEYYGSRNIGLNYGLLFTAYGLAGFFVPKYVNESIIKPAGAAGAAGAYGQMFTLLSIGAVVAVVLALIQRRPTAPASAPAGQAATAA